MEPYRAEFLWSQARAILALDFFTVDLLNGTKVYVLAAIEHGTRRIRVLGATQNPVQSWVVQQARNLTVLREYEDFYNTHRPHRTLNQAARFARCPMASPTWTTSASGGATAPGA